MLSSSISGTTHPVCCCLAAIREVCSLQPDHYCLHDAPYFEFVVFAYEVGAIGVIFGMEYPAGVDLYEAAYGIFAVECGQYDIAMVGFDGTIDDEYGAVGDASIFHTRTGHFEPEYFPGGDAQQVGNVYFFSEVVLNG